MPTRAVAGKRVDDVLHGSSRRAESFVVRGSLGKIGKQPAEMTVRVADEAGFGRETKQRLNHCQGQHFGVGELRCDADSWSFGPPFGMSGQQVVDRDIQCGYERVQIGVHARSSKIDGVVAAPILDALARYVVDHRAERAHPLELII